MSSSLSNTLEQPPIIGHTSLPEKEKRPRVSKKLRRKAKDLEQEMRAILAKYAKDEELAVILETAIKASHDLSASTRKSDRDKVFLLLDEWEGGGLTREDICDETGFSDWTVGGVLEELLGLKLIGSRPGYDPKPSQGSAPLIYFVIHTSPLK